jgi:hypothetical protein
MFRRAFGCGGRRLVGVRQEYSPPSAFTTSQASPEGGWNARTGVKEKAEPSGAQQALPCGTAQTQVSDNWETHSGQLSPARAPQQPVWWQTDVLPMSDQVCDHHRPGFLPTADQMRQQRCRC